jgi:hypothetical protein
VKSEVNLKVLGVLAFMGAGLLVSGCKSTPDLTQTEAQTMIQANYDHATPVGANITVSDLGMRQGITAKYWNRTKIYPNKYWADFTLTPDGKKALKLPSGGDQIQWRPESLDDKNYSIVVVTVAANHLKAKDVSDPQDEVVAGVDTAKGTSFTESVNLDGVPDALQQIAHNPGNKLSTKRQADFALEGGAWKLHSVQ